MSKSQEQAQDDYIRAKHGDGGFQEFNDLRWQLARERDRRCAAEEVIIAYRRAFDALHTYARRHGIALKDAALQGGWPGAESALQVKGEQPEPSGKLP